MANQHNYSHARSRPQTISLAYSTIHVAGSNANDTVDISGLTSAHRVVFDTAGGDDLVIGTLRQQDVINTPAALDLSHEPVLLQMMLGEDVPHVMAVDPVHTLDLVPIDILAQHVVEFTVREHDVV